MLQVARIKSWQPVVGGSSGAAALNAPIHGDGCSSRSYRQITTTWQLGGFAYAVYYCLVVALVLPEPSRHAEKPASFVRRSQARREKRKERKKHAVTHAPTTRTTQTRASCHPSYPPTAEPREFSAPAPKRLYLVFSSPPSMRHAENHQKS